MGAMNNPADLLDVLHATADAVADTLGGLDDWGLAGTRAGQYRSDLAADAVAVELLLAAGLGVLSEESAVHESQRDIVVVIDPLDGSTNASRRVPWYATSLCAVDAEGALAAVVVNLATGDRYEATRGGGARCNGAPIVPSTETQFSTSIVGLSGYPPAHLGWKQYRALGAAALDLCAVACGILDGYLDCSVNAHGVWDYAGGLLVCQEAGACIEDAWGRDLLVLDHAARRTPIAAATPDLLQELLTARATFGDQS
jgi:myo-inositol-1(or 4)-monophosphatase